MNKHALLSRLTAKTRLRLGLVALGRMLDHETVFIVACIAMPSLIMFFGAGPLGWGDCLPRFTDGRSGFLELCAGIFIGPIVSGMFSVVWAGRSYDSFGDADPYYGVSTLVMAFPGIVALFVCLLLAFPPSRNAESIAPLRVLVVQAHAHEVSLVPEFSFGFLSNTPPPSKESIKHEAHIHKAAREAEEALQESTAANIAIFVSLATFVIALSFLFANAVLSMQRFLGTSITRDRDYENLIKIACSEASGRGLKAKLVELSILDERDWSDIEKRDIGVKPVSTRNNAGPPSRRL